MSPRTQPAPTFAPRIRCRGRAFRRRSAIFALTALLVFPLAGYAVAEPAEQETDPVGSQAATRQDDGWVLVPTHPSSRVYTFASLQGIMHSSIEVDGDAPFELASYYGQDLKACLGTCYSLADFDVSFFRIKDDGSTQVLSTHAGIGDEAGRTPTDAGLAMVYLRAPGLLPDGRGYRFEYIQGAPGDAEVPDI